jgi:hypothetical protein
VNDMTSDQKRQSQPVLSVDFVTALTLEECRTRLAQADPVKDQHVSVWDDNSFTVRCCAPDGAKTGTSLWGTLEARERGTWVWGTSIEASGDSPEWPSRTTTILLLILFVLVAGALTRNDPRLLVIGAVLLAGALLWRFWTWQRRHAEALRVIGWVWETLYVPMKEVYPGEAETQD